MPSGGPGPQRSCHLHQAYARDMDKSERDKLIDDLWEMHGKLSTWVGAQMDAADRQELTDARQLVRNVLNRQLGENYLESRPFKAR